MYPNSVAKISINSSLRVRPCVNDLEAMCRTSTALYRSLPIQSYNKHTIVLIERICLEYLELDSLGEAS